jgi:hypothetical protein
VNHFPASVDIFNLPQLNFDYFHLKRSLVDELCRLLPEVTFVTIHSFAGFQALCKILKFYVSFTFASEFGSSVAYFSEFFRFMFIPAMFCPFFLIF